MFVRRWRAKPERVDLMFMVCDMLGAATQRMTTAISSGFPLCGFVLRRRVENGLPAMSGPGIMLVQSAS
jgi:hypothetical protein